MRGKERWIHNQIINPLEATWEVPTTSPTTNWASTLPQISTLQISLSLRKVEEDETTLADYSMFQRGNTVLHHNDMSKNELMHQPALVARHRR
ncbi:MAG: hypothetical protein F6K09_09305 [Merismopedia sp. SIO2A8]|nr:hypothetical protein [Merismopedia sp. SIO2A8]